MQQPSPCFPKRIKRSRTGCWNCKERRRRCTEERPSCAGCLKRGLKCEYGLRLLWQEDAELAGIAFGRAGLKDRFTKDRKSDASYYLIPLRTTQAFFLNTTAADVSRLCDEYSSLDLEDSVPLDRDEDASISASLVPLITKASLSTRVNVADFPSGNSSAKFLLQYYNEVVCSRRVLVDNDQNPFRSVVLPLCHSSQPLLHAVLAAAANDLRNRKDVPNSASYSHAVLFYKSKALELLRESISPDAPQANGASSFASIGIAGRDGMLLTIMLLCYLEIATGSRYEWAAHLSGAASVIRLGHTLGSGEPLFSLQTLRFVYEFLALRDTFSATTLDEENYSKHGQWTSQIPKLYPFLQQVDASKINTNIGLSVELLNIISSITDFARLKYRTRRQGRSSFDQEARFLEQASALKERLDCARQWSDEPDPNHLVYLNAAAFKEAAYIYLYHAAYDEPSHHPSIQERHLPKLLSALRQVHTKQGNLLGSLPYPMWALFIAGCVVQEDDRATILDFFTDLKDHRPISNVPITMDAVEALWKMKDLENAGDGRKNHTVTAAQGFEWENGLVRLGWKMALT